HSKTSAPSSDYVIQAGYSYYDAEEYVLPVCASSPCQNNGTCCIDGCTDDYECVCTENYSGANCETWTGFNGSSTGFPGRSCFYIKLYGKDNGDGNYWIDPTRSGNPFLVQCDMTTEGGGWTVIKAVTLKSSSIPSTDETYFNVYRNLGTLKDHEYVTATGLVAMQTDMGFNQIRYLCRKSSVGRTIHIMTAVNTRGSAAVRYLLHGPSPYAIACDSYIRLSDDKSLLSVNCAKWGRFSS
ncbi:hypothetical protein QZH41_011570, partial [Actinostola sp. cb2023]